jgi:hypothetical protein
MLSQIENHVISPSLGTLIKLAKALEMKMGALISAPGEKAFTIVRKGEGKLLSRFASKAGLSYGYSYQSLCPEMKEWHMEPFLVTLEPASGSKKPSRHEGEEFIYVLTEWSSNPLRFYGCSLFGRFHLLSFHPSPPGGMPRGRTG